MNTLLVRRLDGGDLLLLRDTLRDEGIVLGLLLLLAIDPAELEGTAVAAALEAQMGNEALDFRPATSNARKHKTIRDNKIFFYVCLSLSHSSPLSSPRNRPPSTG